MNQKKAKALRKQAQAMTVGQPERQLVQVKQELNGANQKKVGARFVIGAGNNPHSTRGVYRKLKGHKGISESQVVIEKNPPKPTQVAQATAVAHRPNTHAPTTRKGLLAYLAGLAAKVKSKVLYR